MSNNTRPFSMKIFLVDGDPEGLKIVEKSNRTGAAVVFSRANFLDAAKRRSEFQQTGVYILVGPSERSNLPVIYIGEGDPVKPRLNEHYAKKDFWTWGVFFIAKDNSLNKAHVKYLESRLIEMAQDAKQATLDNTNSSTSPNLTEAERADLDSLLHEDILNVCPLIGLGVFRKADDRSKTKNILYAVHGLIKATGQESLTGFTVFKDSMMRKEETNTIPASVHSLRQDMISAKVVADSGEGYVFTRDYVFPSPSSAAGVILGRSANGRTEWKNKAGKTLKDIQAENAPITA
jgi:hypothetical protein